MADEQQAVNNADTTDQQSPMPSEEQNVADQNQAESISPQGANTQVTTETELPADVKERTAEQFSKLKTQLAQEREQRLKIERMFTQMKQPAKPQEFKTPDYYDPETGTIDVDKLESRNRMLESQLQQLSGTVQSIRDKEQTQQEQETYTVYPELDPNRIDKFNETFHRAVTGYLTDAYLRGENPSFKDAADTINSIRQQDINKAETKGATQALEQLSVKEQAALEATGRSDRRQDVRSNLNDLQQRSRRGDVDAIAERLKGITSV